MHTASAIDENIREISAVEKAALDSRSPAARIGDLIAWQAGKMWFIATHVVWFTIWIVYNLRSGKTAFDPFPFSLLTMIVSLEAIFLSLFILMSQNRSGLQADQRNQLDLQINLLSEVENTKMIQMLQALCKHHQLPVAQDPEIEALALRTNLKQILESLRENLPTPESRPPRES
ncbi:MAG: DUF1003 domain-containing protein [Bryobacteraceae bacterium]|nr:DUF1003 domain-containing protein [Bryobacteraceae bacterium]